MPTRSRSLLFTISTAWALGASAALAAESTIDFAHQVVPVLKKHCVECHGGKESKGGLSLNSRALVLESDAVVVGKPDESRLIELVASQDADEQMPPKDRPRLSDDEQTVLRRWVAEQLPWEAGFSFAESRYEPPLRPRQIELPPIADGRDHPIDRIVDAYFAEHDVARPASASDDVFLRRAYLDIVGLLPTVEERSAFLANQAPDRRDQLVGGLLDRDVDYAEHWLTFWNDLLRNDYTGTGFITGGRKQITPWLHRSLVANKPYNQMVRELIAPTTESEGFIGGIRWRGTVSASQSVEVQFAQNITQAFLGINMKCASCHDSFIDRWTLAETYSLAAVAANKPLTLHRCDKPLDKVATAAWIFPELGQIDATAPRAERLKQLAALMTHEQNGRLTRTIVNRIWQRMLGRGIVHPADAMHTEPFSTDLLDFLAADFAGHGYDLKYLVERICTSEIYQAQSPSRENPAEGSSYVFRGPQARRMTAEQFVDSVWQITGAAPASPTAKVDRSPVARQVKTEGTEKAISITGQWVWSTPEAASSVPPAGEAIVLRRQFQLASKPAQAIAAITCDNEYTLYVNGTRLGTDVNWETVEAYAPTAQLRQGSNEILIKARNAGSSPNPAGVVFEMRLKLADGSQQTIATDNKWLWTRDKLGDKGRFAKEPTDWNPVALIQPLQAWKSQTDSQLESKLSGAVDTVRMVRASLIKSTYLMRALGRPNRDQIVTSRPNELTTLEAINLANGQELNNAVAVGAKRWWSQYSESPDALIEDLFVAMLARGPSEAERIAARQLLSEGSIEQAVADLMWSLAMLPEFQLIR